MTIVEAIERQSVPHGEPIVVLFSPYMPGEDGQRVNNPPEIEEVIKREGWEVPWAKALQALDTLGSKPASAIRVDTATHTMVFENKGAGWRAAEVKLRARSAGS
jgi:hypothetical protein